MDIDTLIRYLNVVANWMVVALLFYFLISIRKTKELSNNERRELQQHRERAKLGTDAGWQSDEKLIAEFREAKRNYKLAEFAYGNEGPARGHKPTSSFVRRGHSAGNGEYSSRLSTNGSVDERSTCESEAQPRHAASDEEGPRP
jgi:hypothetical protein